MLPRKKNEDKTITKCKCYNSREKRHFSEKIDKTFLKRIMQDIFFSIYFKLHAICFKVSANRIFYSTTSNTDKQLNSYHSSSSLLTLTCFNFEDDILLFF